MGCVGFTIKPALDDNFVQSSWESIANSSLYVINLNTLCI